MVNPQHLSVDSSIESPVIRNNNQLPITETPQMHECNTVTNKKRLRSPEEQLVRKQTKISDYWLQKPLPTYNSLSALTEETEENQNNKENQPKANPRPPPITVYKIVTSSYTYFRVMRYTAATELKLQYIFLLVRAFFTRNGV
ncbi:uncharacterized protein LOC143195842 [Rhynchophorus ferrugineus]|uniref:uncharacterized protein LOC143195842 n=1 Tax=Rhynchophorus ferrugineus TaxID=354439 RepID=UPI003FCDCCEE